MTKIEKVIGGAMIAIVVLFLVMWAAIFTAIDNAGGLRSVVVEIGKEVKSIAREIAQD